MSFVHQAWTNADEEARYSIWSTYVKITENTMGPDFPVESYSTFCDAMDFEAAEAGYPVKTNSLYSVRKGAHQPVHLRRN